MFIAHQFTAHEDHSANFAAIRTELFDEEGKPFTALLKDLRPDYPRVWRDIALGYLGLVLTGFGTVWFAQFGLIGMMAAALCGAASFGFWIAYVQLFIHEGAHANLAKDRKTSDLLCDVLVGWMIGTSVRKYRKVHFEHHRAFGTRTDAENTYFRALDMAFILKALTGWRVIEVFAARSRLTAPKAASKPEGAARDRLVLLGGITAHLAILAALLLTGGPAAALAWIVGVGVVFPFLGALRQLLEHRSLEARGAVDYREVDHGAHTRLFGTGPFARLFGAAGFNRHLLHHWEPSVSYTCFDQLEAVFERVGMGPAMDARRTTYGAAFRALYNRK